MKWPTALDLFSGVGGLTAGLRAARFRVLAGVELDGLAVETYRLNFPGVGIWQTDVRDLEPEEVMRELGLARGQLGLLAGCPPCQGFSTIRTKHRRTVRDQRNQLILDFLRFAKTMRPKTLMLENVPGLAKYTLFRRMVSELREIGYSVTWEVHNAADFGVAQRRKRLILVSAAAGDPVLPKPRSAPLTVRQAIAHLPPPGDSGDPLHDLPERRSKRVVSLIRRIPKDGGSRSALAEDQLKCHKALDGFKDVYGRMAWDDVAPTITGGCVNPSKGRFLHPEQDRSITLREALLLQGFPSGYEISLAGGKFAAARMIGNAIPPPMAREHAIAIRPLAMAGSQSRP